MLSDDRDPLRPKRRPAWRLRACTSGEPGDAGPDADGRTEAGSDADPESSLALDAVDDSVFVLDREHHLLRLNRAAAELLGSGAGELLGHLCFQLVHGREKPIDHCPHQAVLRDGRLHTLRVEEPELGGRFDVSCLPLVDTEDAVRGSVHVMRPSPNGHAAAGRLAPDSAAALRATLRATVRALGAVIALRDPDTARHQERVADLAQALAAEMGLPRHVVEGLWYCGHLHDIGKLGVPIEVLGRPGALTPMERRLIDPHPHVAELILATVPFEFPIALTVAQHHERLDGSGYPRGLSGDRITLEARVLAVADVVAAMTAHRPHRPAFSLEAALAEVKAGSGTRFDPEVVTALERLASRGEIAAGE